MTDARLALRDATRPLHDRVEQTVDLASRVADRGAYLGLLRAFSGLHVPMEDRLAALPWAEAGVAFDAHRRVPLLRADLTALGADPADVPLCPTVPAPATLAAGFGVLYVLGGAALGGQIIAREAQAALGLGADGTRFFRSDGRDVGRQWRAFGRALDAHVTTADRFADAAEAAAATFETVGRWIGPPASPSLPTSA